jgi:hypothetical protein
LPEGWLLGGQREDVYVCVFHELLLHTRGGEVDEVPGFLCERLDGIMGEACDDAYSSRIEHPPPVPVTHPRVQNLAHSEGMRLAGWSGLSDVMSWSALLTSRRGLLATWSVAILMV